MILGLAALCGAVGALAVQGAASWLTSDSDNSEVQQSHRRRTSVVPSGDFANLGFKRQDKVIKAILFDMDGTLVRSERIWFLLLSDALKHFQSPIEIHYDEWLKNNFGQSMEDNVTCYFKGYATVEELDEFCCQNYEKYISLLEVIPGAAEVLVFASQVTNAQTYIVTNCPRRIAEIILKSTNCEPLVSSLTNPDGTIRMLCPGDQGTSGPLVPKPSISMISQASHLFSASTHDMILVGDSVYDIEAIQAAGGIGVLLTDSQHQHQPNEDPIKNPFLKINSLMEFFQVQQLFQFPAIFQ